MSSFPKGPAREDTRMTKIVRITMEGGVIQDIEVPKGMRVVVRDYDTEGVETERLQRDEDGNEFIEAIWE